MRNFTSSIVKWNKYFILMDYTAPLPSLEKASRLRDDTIRYYQLRPVVATFLDELDFMHLESEALDTTARYALLARHALLLHSRDLHESEALVYAYLQTTKTTDWPMKRDTVFNQIRCLRERYLHESDRRKYVDLCQQTVMLVEKDMRILRDHYTDPEWTRSTLVRDEKDFLLLASMEAKDMLSIPYSDDEADLLRRAERRLRYRKHRSPYMYGKFWHDHREELVKFWKKYRPVWYKNRYRERYGREPEHEPVIRYPSGGWSIHPDYREFDDSEKFLRDAENSYRESQGLPLRGQGWTSETHLKLLVRKIAAPVRVLFEHSPTWLYPQRFDIFIPDLKLAIEYMGEQHYWAIDHFGGQEAFQERVHMDAQKRSLAHANGITVLDWRFDQDTNETTVKQWLSHYLLEGGKS